MTIKNNMLPEKSGENCEFANQPSLTERATPICEPPPPVNDWDIREDEVRLVRAEICARFAGHAAWIAGDVDFAAELLAEASRLTFSDAELRAAISNGTEMGEAA